jgi:hypothetical protein
MQSHELGYIDCFAVGKPSPSKITGESLIESLKRKTFDAFNAPGQLIIRNYLSGNKSDNLSHQFSKWHFGPKPWQVDVRRELLDTERYAEKKSRNDHRTTCRDSRDIEPLSQVGFWYSE